MRVIGIFLSASMPMFVSVFPRERRIDRLVHNALACSVQILELAALHRPEKCAKPRKPHAERDRNQPCEEVAHASTGRKPRDRVSRACPPDDRRSALATTRIDDVDMAIAAISGVTYPAIASGRASAL